jgi:hypothetical protein
MKSFRLVRHPDGEIMLALRCPVRRNDTTGQLVFMYDFFFTVPISNNQDSAPGVWGMSDAQTLEILAIQLQEMYSNTDVSDTDVSNTDVSNTDVLNLSFLLWNCFNNMFFPYTDNDREDWEAEDWYEPDIVKAGLEQGTIIWCYSQHCAVQFDFANDLSHVNVF